MNFVKESHGARTDGFNTLAASKLTPIEKAAKELLGQGERLTSADYEQKLILEQKFKGQLRKFQADVAGASQSLANELQKRKVAAIDRRDRNINNRKSTSAEQKTLSIYEQFQQCIQRLTLLPQLLHCQILGCDQSPDPSSEESHETVGPEEPEPEEEPAEEPEAE